MANSKVELADGTVLMDLTEDTVTAETLAEGATAHDASGNPIVGVAPTDAVRYAAAQSLTEAQQEQARANIGAQAAMTADVDYVTPASVAQQIQTLLNRTTAVDAADTNYTTFMARGFAIASATEVESLLIPNGAAVLVHEG